MGTLVSYHTPREVDARIYKELYRFFNEKGLVDADFGLGENGGGRGGVVDF